MKENYEKHLLQLEPEFNEFYILNDDGKKRSVCGWVDSYSCNEVYCEKCPFYDLEDLGKISHSDVINHIKD